MSECVLVHGSFHGGWVWNDVSRHLRKKGHTIHTPTLTGVGEKSHLISPHIGLSVNIMDITNFLKYKNLTDVVLVGHSYAGLVITGVAEKIPDRIQRLVYFDGYIPEDGQSAWEITPDAKKRWESQAQQIDSDWLVPPPNPADKYGEKGTRADQHLEKLTPMAMWTHEEPISLPMNRAADLPRSYIECTEYETFRHMAQKARDSDFNCYKMDTHHNPIFYMPDRTSEILLTILKSNSQ